MKRNCGQWGHRLRQCGYKCTPGREAILEILECNEGHLSPEEIFTLVSKEYPEIGLTTVYRTLEILVRLGIIVKLEIGDGKSRYELSENHGKKSHHHHLICDSCGKIVDYSDFIDEEVELITKIEKTLEKKRNFKIEHHIIQFHGLCGDCYVENGRGEKL